MVVWLTFRSQFLAQCLMIGRLSTGTCWMEEAVDILEGTAVLVLDRQALNLTF